MKVFISWSGERSGHIAKALYHWLPLVINAVEPWLSTEDVNAGTRWNGEISKNLQESSVGIFCLTAENLDSQWLAFEAGAISKVVEESHACTYLHGIGPSDVKWPLAQFQAKTTTKESTFEMIRAINRASGSPLLREELLSRSLDKWWPELESQILATPPSKPGVKAEKRDSSELLEEVLLLLRRQSRELPSVVAQAAVARQTWEPAPVQMMRALHALDPDFSRFSITKVSRGPSANDNSVTLRENTSGGELKIHVLPKLLDDPPQLANHLRGHLSEWLRTNMGVE